MSEIITDFDEAYYNRIEDYSICESCLCNTCIYNCKGGVDRCFDCYDCFEGNNHCEECTMYKPTKD